MSFIVNKLQSTSAILKTNWETVARIPQIDKLVKIGTVLGALYGLYTSKGSLAGRALHTIVCATTGAAIMVTARLVYGISHYKLSKNQQVDTSDNRDRVVVAAHCDPFSPTERKIKTTLLWEDLACMRVPNCSLGLRHECNQAQAESIQSFGTWGDSLNLDFTSSKTWEKCFSDQENKQDLLDEFLLWPERFSIEHKERITSFMSEGMKHFLQGYFVTAASSFVLIDYKNEAKQSYDNDRYYGLGKKGNRQITPAQVIAIIPPSLEHLEGKAQADYYFSSIVRAIHEYSLSKRSGS